jgi:4-hydroxybenzoate polyprenyltransferase
MIAAGIGVYIVGVTVFAKQEAGTSRGPVLLVGVINMMVGVLVLGAGLGYLPPQDAGWKTEIVWLLLGLLMVTVVRRALTAVVSPSAARVQVAVKHSILSLIWLDAAAALATAPPLYAMCIAALLIPALLLGMWVYST